MRNNNVINSLSHVEECMHELVLLHPGDAADAATEHLSAGGSRVRASIAVDACRALAVPNGIATAVAAACELLHNASLIHDDLQDRSEHRRGRHAIWKTYGASIAICAGDLMLSAAYAALSRTGPASAGLVMTMHKRVSAVVRGQCKDLALKGDTLSRVDMYENIAAEKSGPLLILPLELGLTLAGRLQAIEVAEQVGVHFAVGYQVADDISDVEIDAANKQMNIVAVLAARGHPNPDEAALALAVDRFCLCDTLAAQLPSNSGNLIATLARRRAVALQKSTAVTKAKVVA